MSFKKIMRLNLIPSLLNQALSYFKLSWRWTKLSRRSQRWWSWTRRMGLTPGWRMTRWWRWSMWRRMICWWWTDQRVWRRQNVHARSLGYSTHTIVWTRREVFTVSRPIFKSFVFLDEIVIKKGYRRNHLSAILFGLPTPNRMTCETKLQTKQLHFWDTPSYRACFIGWIR